MEQPKYRGLTDIEVKANRVQFGSNISIEDGKQNVLWQAIKGILTEPLFIILVSTTFIYFLLREYNEGIIMLLAIGFVSGISVFQENRSHNAIDALKKLSSPRAKVIRNATNLEISSEEIVMNDLIIVEDGDIIPADAKIIEAHDFSVNESSLTGESLPVDKSSEEPGNKIFQGTMVMAGSCIAQTIGIGKQTAFGKIGQSLQKIQLSQTPLQQQIKNFVRSMVRAGAIAFIVVWIINYYLSGEVLQSLLRALTLAMSILPEEIPVAFSTFMALGAYHLYKRKVIVRSPHTVETLGTATVICTDKTGTITENKMQLSAIYDFSLDKIYDFTKEPYSFNPVLEHAMWASEINPFDPMEKSIHEIYKTVVGIDKRPFYSLIHEYPLGGKPPIMTHVFSDKKTDHIIAVKGSVEGVLNQSKLSAKQKATIQDKAVGFASKGFRVLAVAKSNHDIRNLPPSQQDLEFDFIGLVAFYDPPKENIKETIRHFYDAGINVKMITGDYSETARAIASQIQMKDCLNVLTGNDVLKMSKMELQKKAGGVDIYTRMFPEAKLKVIEALKANGEVVAMTGDGVNDGPALRASHIGIAMGLRGSEIAKKEASLILMDDNLIHMVEAVAIGRRIYENLKKAIRYIISIHIPIILIVTVPLLFFWRFIDFFSPIHVIFLELIMGPTCSIVFEREPIEPNSMRRAPRKMSASFFSLRELSLSIVQGLLISFTCLGLGYYYMINNHSEPEVRTMIYTTLIFSNLFLTLVNRSFQYSVLETIRYKNNLIPVISGISLIVLFLSIYISPLQHIFQFVELKIPELLFCFTAAFIGVMWIEVYKWIMKKTKKTDINQLAL